MHRWKVHLVGYNSVADMYRSIFIRLAVVASKICEITRISELIAVQGHPMSSILVPIENAYASSY